MRIAVIGAGISGLAAAWLLSRSHRVTLFEANDYPGGHTHTVDVELEGRRCGVDTGFLVFNDATYPNLVPLLQSLKVPLATTDMSFSLSLEEPAIAWSGTSLDTLFAQRRNLLRPGFLRMLGDILRFNREAARLADGLTTEEGASLGDFLQRGRYSAQFRDWYLLPMAAAIWSCPTREMLEFPASRFARFFRNHGLLQISNRPQWRTVQGGARQYVDLLVSDLHRNGSQLRLNSPVQAVRRDAQGVELLAAAGAERFDRLVFACHSDQALRLLGKGATQPEREVLGAIPYQRNRALLHTDEALLPSQRKLWSAWNYSAARPDPQGTAVSVHYLINKLQPLPFTQPVIVSLNPHREPRADRIIGEYQYEHPLFLAGSGQAQRRLPGLQGLHNTWFCGAWTRYGFHEDGLASALSVAAAFGVQAPWKSAAPDGLRMAA